MVDHYKERGRDRPGLYNLGRGRFETQYPCTLLVIRLQKLVWLPLQNGAVRAAYTGFSAKWLWCLLGKVTSISDYPSSSQTGSFCWSAKSPLPPSSVSIILYFLIHLVYDMTISGAWGPGLRGLRTESQLCHFLSLNLSGPLLAWRQ